MRRTGAAVYRVIPPVYVGALYVSSRQSPFWGGAAWALVLYVSMVGWGALVERIVSAKCRVDIGLRASWGLAATLGVGGVAAMFHLASKPFLVVQIIIGCALAIAARALDKDRPPNRRWIAATMMRCGPYLVVASFLIWLAFEYLGQLATPPSNQSDDQVLYMYLAEKLVQTGSFFDPFDVRRITSYGGQFFLHAQYLVAGTAYQLNVVDCGVGLLLVFGNVVGMIAPRSLRRADGGHLGTALLLVFALGSVRFNIASLMTGVAMGLGSYRTLLWNDTQETRQVRALALLALCAVATCLLRTSSALVIVATVGLATLARPAMVGGAHRATLVTGLHRTALLGALFLLWLLPWLVMFRESCGTFVYPLGRGNITSGFVLLKPEPGFAYNVKHFIGDIGNDRPLITSLVILMAGLAPGFHRRDKRLTYIPLLSTVCVLGVLLLSYAGGAFEDWINARYYFAFLVWTAVAISASVQNSSASWAMSSRGALVLAATVVHVALMHEEIRKRFYANVDAFDRATKNAPTEFQADDWKTQEYRDVQYRLPAGVPIAVVTAEPFRFDMRRNPIYSLDQPGGMGPDGGFPLFRGPVVFRDYLLHHSVKYIIAMSFHTSHELYDIERWRRHKLLEHSFLAYEAPLQIDAMESIEALEKTGHVVYTAHDLMAVDFSSAATQ